MDWIKGYTLIAVTLAAIFFLRDWAANSKAIKELREEIEKLRQERRAHNILEILIEQPNTIAGFKRNDMELKYYLRRLKPYRSNLERTLSEAIRDKLIENAKELEKIWNDYNGVPQIIKK